MAKATKMTSFFNENRRECALTSYLTLMTTGEEKRIKLDVVMPLSNKSVVAMPEWISEPWASMEKQDSLTTRSNIDVMLEGMTIDFFSTDTIKNRELTVSGCTLKGFHLLTIGEGEKKETVLAFTVYVPGSISLRDWTWENLRKTFFAEFAYSQTEMDFGEDGESDGEEDPLEQCDNCEEMFPASQLEMTPDDVKLCPACMEANNQDKDAKPVEVAPAARGRRSKAPFDPAAIQRAAGNKPAAHPVN